MPGKTTLFSLLLLLFLFPLRTEAQPALLDCSFDWMHRLRLARDGAYQRQQRQVESILLQKSRERLQRVDRREEDRVYQIPVVVHIFYPPGTPEGSMSRPTPGQVLRSIERLNDGFRNRGDYSGDPQYSNAGIPAADVGIEFKLATFGPDGNPVTGVFENPTSLAGRPIDDQVSEVEVLDSLRRLSGWPADRYLNIYVLPDLCDQQGDCPVGFAYQAAAHGRKDDGVYVFSKALITETEILIHEVGHYLNLYHTFETGCAEEDCLTGGDRICDTPPDCYPTRCSDQIPNCLKGDRQNTCSNDAHIANSPFSRDVEDLYENFMDYGFWKCFNSFTPGQRARMRDALLLFRSSLLLPPEKDSCVIETVELLSVDSCLAPGDTGIALLQIEYTDAPDTGMLLVNGTAFSFSDSIQYLPLPVSPAETPQAISIFFSADTTCRFRTDSLFQLPPCLPTFSESCNSAPLLAVGRTDTCREERWFTPEPLSAGTELPELCSPYPDRVQWVRLAIPETGTFRLSARSTSDKGGLAAAVFTHCDSLPVLCRKADPGKELLLTLSDLRYGDTLQIACWPTAEDELVDIGLCAFLADPPPDNDECSGALLLSLSDPQLGQTCSSTRRVEWTGALNSTVTDECIPASGGDVWFYAIAPESGSMRIRTLGEGSTQTGIAAYDRCNGNLLACAEQNQSSGTELHLQALKPQDTIWLRVYPLVPQPGEVRLCATIPAAPAPNDFCQQAQPLSVHSTTECTAMPPIGNIIVSSSGTATNCEGEAVEALWYQVVVPSGGRLVVKAETAAGILSPGLAAYRSCDGERLACYDPDSEQASLSIQGLPPGDTLYLAVWDFFRFQFGSVSLCAHLPFPPPNDDCEHAIALPVCVDSTCTTMILQDLQRATTRRSFPWPECNPQTSGELWYKMPTPGSGRLLLELFPGPESIAGLSAYLGCRAEALGCINSTDDKDPQLLLTDLPPGDTLLIAVWSLSDSTGIRASSPSCSPFELSLLTEPVSCYQARDGSATIITPDTSASFFYRWSTGATAPQVDHLEAGDYSLTVSNSMLCSDTLHFSLSAPPPLLGSVGSSATLPGASTGKIQITASGGTRPFRYQLGEEPPQSQSTYDSLAAGAYPIQILDANGCSWRDTVEVGVLTAQDRPPTNVASLRLFPNPAKDFLQVELTLKKPAPVHWVLLDLAGRQIRNGQNAAARWHALRLSLGPLPAGMYALQMEIEGRRISRKFRKD